MNFEILEFYAGKAVSFGAIAKRLTQFGYARQAQVSAPGEFAIRGSIVDIFPLYFSFPVRLELADETVESIFNFDPATGHKMQEHSMVMIVPIKEGQRPKGLRTIWDPEAAPMDPFVDIEAGDTMVHAIHGIARYKGVQAVKNHHGVLADHFVLEFAGRTLLYVPTKDMHLLQRYVAFGKLKPKLSKLGSKQWEKLKSKTKKGVISFAAELAWLQAQRRALMGHTYQPDTPWQKKLEEEFPYEETPDQERAWNDVRADMESATPMDRLLCGDVGYGKTEVALRAAFKAVMDGKQVAILVPTTLLAEQHTETFTERMKSFPVRIGMLSRFQNESQQRACVAGLRDGSCDIVIGTHRLLSKDVSFKDLGLVVIDEEQRFGVRHKEHLKRLRLLVDVLTLTATPIPRTLYLSIVGARDMSVINTPPRNRRPITTRVVEKDDAVMRQAILKERARQGQTFFIYNRVKGIENMAKKVAALVPEARLAVAHGQMPAKPLEAIMKKFIHGEIDVLISTNIVESGIDIPNANTLIVYRADLFGLSELYQLRGRVGRFDRDAYAYFLIPKGAVLTEETQRKLSALERFTYLGAGFGIAMEDLEIRGAGNILGTQQHGFIASVGFDLYCRILRDAVAALRKNMV